MSDELFIFKISQGKVAGGLIKPSLSSYVFDGDKLIHNGNPTNTTSLSGLSLKKDNQKYVIIKNGNTILEVSEEDIIGKDRDAIIHYLGLNSRNKIRISSTNIVDDDKNFALELFYQDGSTETKGILNFINFDNINNNTYFTITQESNGYIGCISDEDGNCKKLIRNSSFLYHIPMDKIIGPNLGRIKPIVLREIATADKASNGNVSKNLAVLLGENVNNQRIILTKLGDSDKREKILSILKSNTGIFEVLKDYASCERTGCATLAVNTLDNLITQLKEQDILTSLKSAVVEELRGDPSLKGSPGTSPTPAQVATYLVTSNSVELGSAILDATGSDSKNLATQVADKVSLNPQDFANKVDGEKLTEGITNKLTPAEAKRIAERTVNAITSDATRTSNPDPEAFGKYEKFAEKLAESLVDRSNMTPEEVDSFVREKVSEWALARYLIVRSNLNDVNRALPFVKEEIDQEKLVKELLNYAGLKSDRNTAKITVEVIANNFLKTKKAEIVQAMLGEKDSEDKGILVNDLVLQQGIAAKLREEPGAARGPKGEHGLQGEEGLQGPIGPQGEAGPKGEDANHLEIVNRLKNDSALQQGVAVELRANPGAAKGPKGDPSPAGKDGRDGATGLRGQDGPAARPEDVAAQLVTDTHLTILSTAVAQKSELQMRVAAQLRTNPENVQGPKGDTGLRGQDGRDGASGPKGDTGLQGKQGPPGQKGDKGEKGETGQPGKDGDPGPAGPKGEKGETGSAGQDGRDGAVGQNVNPEDVAAQLVTDTHLTTLSTAVAQKSELQTQVAKELRTNPGNAQGPQGATGKDGLPGENGRNAKPEDVAVQLVADSKQSFTLQQGDELPDGNYEASIVLNGKPVATLPKIGYYMLSGELVIRNHITKEEVKIPKDFHYLKVTKSSSNDDYQLTFCNFLGNEFFEYKKYDPQYSNVQDEYRYINLNYMKKEYNPKFCKLLNHQPSFFITEGIINPDFPDHCSADVFELTNNGKDRKMATLIDQFGFFNQEGEFQYRDYHTETKPSPYDSYEISKRYISTDTNNEFYFNDNMIFYTTPEL